MKSEEKYTRKWKRVIWILMLQEAVKASNESNWNPTPNYQERWDLLQNGLKKPWNVPSLIATLLIKRNMIMSQIQRVRWDPYVDTNPQNAARWHLNILKEIKTSTERPVTVDQKEEHNIDFRVPGLSHSVVMEAEHLRVQELEQRIEDHPHRAALQADLQQNSTNNPFSENSKEMIRELGHVELFELCETILKVQCSHCLLYWNQGIVYCTCGQCLIDSESTRKFNKLRLDALSIPNYVIKKGPTQAARHGKTEVQREHHLAWNAWKRCCTKVDSQGVHFTGIHDRFLRDPVYRESQLAIGWSEQKVQRVGWTCERRAYI